MKKILDKMIEDRIINLLEDHPEGLSIQDISFKTKLSRVVCGEYLQALIKEKIVYQRVVGQTKLHYLKKYKDFSAYSIEEKEEVLTQPII